jgi:RNA polymerase sigma-70 factor (ECF subfamily)
MAEGGDPWQIWLDRHGAALVLFARQWVKSHADAEDVVQDAFVNFWKSRERVAAPVAYLYSCVRRGALDWQRSGKRRLRREEAMARSEAEPMFAGACEHDERRMAIEAALVALPEKQREVVVLRIWGELSFRQIGAALQVSADTAASRYRYGLAKLHEALAEESIL